MRTTLYPRFMVVWGGSGVASTVLATALPLEWLEPCKSHSFNRVWCGVMAVTAQMLVCILNDVFPMPSCLAPSDTSRLNFILFGLASGFDEANFSELTRPSLLDRKTLVKSNPISRSRNKARDLHQDRQNGRF